MSRANEALRGEAGTALANTDGTHRDGTRQPPDQGLDAALSAARDALNASATLSKADVAERSALMLAGLIEGHSGWPRSPLTARRCGWIAGEALAIALELGDGEISKRSIEEALYRAGRDVVVHADLTDKEYGEAVEALERRWDDLQWCTDAALHDAALGSAVGLATAALSLSEARREDLDLM